MYLHTNKQISMDSWIIYVCHKIKIKHKTKFQCYTANDVYAMHTFLYNFKLVLYVPHGDVYGKYI